ACLMICLRAPGSAPAPGGPCSPARGELQPGPGQGPGEAGLESTGEGGREGGRCWASRGRAYSSRAQPYRSRVWTTNSANRAVARAGRPVPARRGGSKREGAREDAGGGVRAVRESGRIREWELRGLRAREDHDPEAAAAAAAGGVVNAASACAPWSGR
ncbi:hypothetical protein BD413DRAFT_528712, partial [Trametes elegans]